MARFNKKLTATAAPAPITPRRKLTSDGSGNVDEGDSGGAAVGGAPGLAVTQPVAAAPGAAVAPAGAETGPQAATGGAGGAGSGATATAAPPAHGPNDVQVNVPLAFQLRTDDNKVHKIPAGVQWLDKGLARHWYAKAHQVVLLNEQADTKE